MSSKANLESPIVEPSPGQTREAITESLCDALPSGRKLRLLLVITRLTVGGDTNVLLDIARHFTNHPTIEAEIAAGPVPPHEIDLTHLAHESRIPTRLISNLSNRPDPLVMTRAVLEMRKLMRGRYDIVHTHSSVAGVIGRTAALLSGVPVIVHHVHGWGLQEGMSIGVKSAYLGLERVCARYTHRLVAVSDPNIQKGIAHHIGSRDKYTLIYNGIDLQRFAQQEVSPTLRLDLGLDPNSKLVGMIGRLDRQKNPLDFIRAAAIVLRQYPEVQFVIVGDGALRPQCEELISELNLQHRCILLGFRNDVHKILPLLTAVASTSLWEGLPVVFQEAMCAGIPVVANDVDGVSDIVRDGETGFLVTPHHRAQMANRILRLLRDRGLCSRFGARARQASADFSTERMLQQIETLYMELAACHIAGTRSFVKSPAQRARVGV